MRPHRAVALATIAAFSGCLSIDDAQKRNPDVSDGSAGQAAGGTGGGTCAVDGAACDDSPVTKSIVASGTGRRWSDGTYAKSCAEYLNPPSGYAYQGQIGSGAYTIELAGGPTDVYCDMSANGGGWTLCASFGQQKLGANSAAGFDFLDTDWHTAGTVFLSGDIVQSYGNVCSSMPFSQVVAVVLDGTSVSTNSKFETTPIPVSENPFSPSANGTVAVAGGAIASAARTTLTPGYFAGANCPATTNTYEQGSVLCVGDNNGNYQAMQGNINSSDKGDWMCALSTHCGQSQDVILIYVK